ncbi:hypothetical protein BDA99DRAFT_523410 [Phascolomyces articulosus]|uniref:EF-hand domain-containing protein n=1 Tax=Phascolomyces articulosus TaxID=60185 RepID=A0AAD5PAV3_9FUNG|nr:hypothetical protein BDA99DRAFT_523410 [Phascolomyces articulosus]
MRSHKEHKSQARRSFSTFFSKSSSLSSLQEKSPTFNTMASSKRSSLGLQMMSTRKRLELEEMFTAFDKDKDGKVSPAELQEMLKSAGVSEASGTTAFSMLQNVHTDKDGNLTFEEFAKLMRPTLSNPIRLTKKQQELKEAFDAFDRDGNGVINSEELLAMMQQLGDRITKEEAEKMIQEADHDQDGVINFHEFSLMMGVKPPSHHDENSGSGGLFSPTSPTSPTFTNNECPYHQHRRPHRYSVRKFFCKCHQPHSS